MKLRIDRIDLHLRNVSLETAKEAAHLLGPELARALAPVVNPAMTRPARSTSIEAASGRPEQDAGRRAIGTGLDAHALATSIAGRIAAKASKG